MKAQSQSHAVRISSEFSQKISDPKWPSGRFCKMIFVHDIGTGGNTCVTTQELIESVKFMDRHVSSQIGL